MCIEIARNAHKVIPGIAFNNKRTQIVSAFEEALRHKFIIRSKRLLNEMYTFVYINVILWLKFSLEFNQQELLI